MPIKLQGSSAKLMCNNHGIAKMYCENNVFYSSGNTITYTVTYHVDTGVTYQEEVDEGASCLSPKTFIPEKSGWEFAGWRQDTEANGDVISELLMGDAPITLYAVFAQTITLSYNGNSATSGSTAAQTGYRYYNDGNVANPGFTLRSNGFSRGDYTFSKWALGSTSGTQYAAGASLTLSASTTMYAVWTINAFRPILNGILQSGYYTTASRIEQLSYSGYDLPNVAISDKVYGHYGHNGANGSNYGDGVQGAMVTFYTRGCSKVQIAPFLFGQNVSGSLVVYGDGVQLHNSNSGSSTITINVLGYSSVQVIFKASSNQSAWLAGGIQTITCS